MADARPRRRASWSPSSPTRAGRTGRGRAPGRCFAGRKRRIFSGEQILTDNARYTARQNLPWRAVTAVADPRALSPPRARRPALCCLPAAQAAQASCSCDRRSAHAAERRAGDPWATAPSHARGGGAPGDDGGALRAGV